MLRRKCRRICACVFLSEVMKIRELGEHFKNVQAVRFLKEEMLTYIIRVHQLGSVLESMGVNIDR